MKKLLFLLLSSILSTSFAGGYETGNSLYERMSASRVGEQVYTKGYLIGVVDAEYRNCNLRGVTDTQIYDSVKQYLNNYPERRNLKASDIIKFVMNSKYDCKN